MIGKSISHYRITDKIGEGGMGEVFRASDIRLQREVALKVLPELLAADPQRMGRFSREAHVLASLNHPNIAAIYGLEEADGKQALIMELVEGSDLSERIREGPMPVEEAVRIALQLAEALEAAHEKGVIHRDLKPANIKITPQGRVKVLDFGLAKALEGDLQSPADLSRSPTLSMAATQAGMILGTAGYMSPEQAKGTAVDRRADIWSFGVVLLEMLTGRTVFKGDTVAETMAAVIKEHPDWDRLPAGIPPAIGKLLRRCLEKDPGHRLQAIGEARIILSDWLSNPQAAEPAEVGAALQPGPASRSRRALLGAAVVVAIGLAGFLGTFWAPAPAPPLELSVKVELDQEGSLFTAVGPSVAVSPAADRIAYVLGDGVQRQIFLRQLNQLEGVVLAGTEEGYHPFFSPDGQWVGFFSRTELKKVSVTGGAPLRLCSVNLNRGGSWGEDGMIYFAPNPSGGLFRVSSAGGNPEELTQLAEGEDSHRWPQALPGGRGVLFTSHTSDSQNYDQANIEVVDLKTNQRKVVQRGGTFGRYLKSGHLIYFQQGTMYAVKMDLETLELQGSPAPVLEDVVSDPGDGGAQIDFSDQGLMAYVYGTAALPTYSMLWVDRNGNSQPMTPEPKTFAEPRFSPDGTRLAVQIATKSFSDAWIYDLRRGVASRLTFDETDDAVPVWSPDGKWIAYSANRDGAYNIYRKLADGTGDIERLTEAPLTQYISSWSPDGKYLLYSQYNNQTSADLMVVPVDGDRKPEVFLSTQFQELEGAFSPDGRWVAYQSNESGQTEIYVRPFPVRGGKWQISLDGGSNPRWSANGKEIYYRRSGELWVVSVTAEAGSLQVGTPRQVFTTTYSTIAFAGSIFGDYDVAPDGRFVMFRGDDERAQTNHVTLVTNWYQRIEAMLNPKN